MRLRRQGERCGQKILFEYNAPGRSAAVGLCGSTGKERTKGSPQSRRKERGQGKILAGVGRTQSGRKKASGGELGRYPLQFGGSKAVRTARKSVQIVQTFTTSTVLRMVDSTARGGLARRVKECAGFFYRQCGGCGEAVVKPSTTRKTASECGLRRKKTICKCVSE